MQLTINQVLAIAKAPMPVLEIFWASKINMDSFEPTQEMATAVYEAGYKKYEDVDFLYTNVPGLVYGSPDWLAAKTIASNALTDARDIVRALGLDTSCWSGE